MLNRYVAGMLVAGLAITLVQAEIIPNNFAAEQMSRYEPIGSISSLNQEYSRPEELPEIQAPQYNMPVFEVSNTVPVSFQNEPIKTVSSWKQDSGRPSEIQIPQYDMPIFEVTSTVPVSFQNEQIEPVALWNQTSNHSQGLPEIQTPKYGVPVSGVVNIVPFTFQNEPAEPVASWGEISNRSDNLVEIQAPKYGTPAPVSFQNKKVETVASWNQGSLRSQGVPEIKVPQYEMPNLMATNVVPETFQADCKQLMSMNNACILNSHATRQGLSSQIKYLEKFPSYRRFANKGVNLSGRQLLDTARGVLRWLDSQEGQTDRFELVNLSRFATNYANSTAKFTGYYTPEIMARKYYSPEYRFPIYRKPTDARRTLARAEINNGALENGGYEIAWVKNPIDLYYIHMQGSGVLTFEDGERKTLQYVGSNGLSFKSIAVYMQQVGYLKSDLSRRAITEWFEQYPETMGEVFAHNPRYIYFNLRDEMALTASGIKPVPGHTVAVDTGFIPFGAVLLAEVPKIDQQGMVLGYEWRLLFPQDRGNAIRGHSRLDFYTGTGELARAWANKVTGLRQAYLLLDKGQQSIQVASAK